MLKDFLCAHNSMSDKFFEIILLQKYETTDAHKFILSRCNEISKLYNFETLTYFSFWFFFLVVGKVILYKTAKN